MVRVYYDITLWEEVEASEMNEKLKPKAGEFVKRFQGYGMVSYNMRTEQVAPPVYDEQQAPQEQYVEEPQEGYADDAVQPEPPVSEQEVQDEM